MIKRNLQNELSLFDSDPAQQVQTNERPVRTTTSPQSTNRQRQPVDAHELWDIDQVASYLGVPKQTIYTWRTTGYGPRGFRVGKHLRWRATTVVQWTVSLESEQ